MDKEKLLEQILDILKTSEVHTCEDDTFLVYDLEYRLIGYSIEHMILFEQVRIGLPLLSGSIISQPFKRTIAKFKVKNNDIEIVESISKEKLSELLKELQEKEIEKHVL